MAILKNAAAWKKAAAIGGGVIGAGWVARLLENGIDVAVYDPAPEAERRLQAVLDNAERAYAKLTLAPRPKKGALSFRPSIAEAVEGAELIVESVPERLDKIGRAHVRTPVTNAHPVCRLLLDKKKTNPH